MLSNREPLQLAVSLEPNTARCVTHGSHAGPSKRQLRLHRHAGAAVLVTSSRLPYALSTTALLSVRLSAGWLLVRLCALSAPDPAMLARGFSETLCMNLSSVALDPRRGCVAGVYDREREFVQAGALAWEKLPVRELACLRASIRFHT